MSTESPPNDPAAATRAWLLQHQVATLSTTSVHRGLEGYPYASVAPFALDPEGRPVILISTLAAHTQNLQADPRGALLVREPDTGPDPQTGWRVSLMGDWEKVPRGAAERSQLHARYLQRVPGGQRYDALNDFDYWRMSTVQKIRYIGGFGKITWLRGDAVKPAADEAWRDAAASAVAHMNEDHADNLVEMCRGFYGVTPVRATLTTLDRDGFVVRAEDPDRELFFAFGRDLAAGDLRVAMIQVLKEARSRSQT